MTFPGEMVRFAAASGLPERRAEYLSYSCPTNWRAVMVHQVLQTANHNNTRSEPIDVDMGQPPEDPSPDDQDATQHPPPPCM